MKTGTAGTSLQRSVPGGCSHPAPLPWQIQPVPGNRTASWQSQPKPVGGGPELCWCHCLTSPEISSIAGAAAGTGPHPRAPGFMQGPHPGDSVLPSPISLPIPKSLGALLGQGGSLGVSSQPGPPQFLPPCTPHHRDTPTSHGFSP